MWFHVIFGKCYKTTHFKLNRGIKMTQSRKTMSNRKIGQRFKELIKEFDGKQEITAMYLNCCKTTISRYCNGNYPIPNDVIEKVSKKWNVREEYIKCEDNFKTSDEIFHHQFEKDHEKYKKTLEYLSLLDFKTTYSYLVICPAHKFEEFKKLVEPYLYIEPDLEPEPFEPFDIRLCNPIEYQRHDDDSIVHELFSASEIDILSKGNYVSFCILFNKISSANIHPKILLTDYFEKIDDLPLLDGVNLNKDFCGLTTGYRLNYHGLDMGFCSLHRLKRLFHVMNKQNQLCIDLFISGHIA